MGYPTTKTSKKEYVDALVKVRSPPASKVVITQCQNLQAQFNDELLPLITVMLNGMLESLSYLRQSCFEEEPGDEGCKHGGEYGRTKMHFRLRVPRRVNA